jgi:hypothetical protein
MSAPQISINHLGGELMIQGNRYDIKELISLLSPIESYVTHSFFLQKMDEVSRLIIPDQDQLSDYDWVRLRRLSHDPGAMIALLSMVMLVICAIPDLKFKYKPQSDITEDLIFKLVGYLFLVIVPNKMTHPLTLEDQAMLLNLTVDAYQTLRSSQVIQPIIDDANEKVKSDGWSWSHCMIGPTADSAEKKLEKHLPLAQLRFSMAMIDLMKW